MLSRQLLVLVSLAAVTSQGSDRLRVIRATPQGTVVSADQVLITFDRPVAAGLEQTVDPTTIFRIEPTVEGSVRWRDPVTLRFVPAAPLATATRYTVRVSTDFQAMDGSRLDEPYVFDFHLEGPRVLASEPVGEHTQPPANVYRLARPDQEFDLLLSVPAGPAMRARLDSAAFVSLEPRCPGPDRIGLRVSEQRPLDEEADGWRFVRFARRGPWSGENADRLRVVTLVPTRDLPLDCTAWLVVPEQLERIEETRRSWTFRTYGPLELTAGRCGGGKYCPVGPAVVYFSNPVSGGELLRHVRLAPAVDYTIPDTLAESAAWRLEAELRPRRSYALIVEPEIRDVFGQSLSGDRVAGLTTTGYAPSISYPRGRWLVERSGPRSLSVQHINIDTLVTIVAPIPRSYEHRFLWTRFWNWWELWDSVAAGAARRSREVAGEADEAFVSSIRLPAYDATRPNGPTLMAVRFDSPQLDTLNGSGRWRSPLSLIQVTDLGLHAKLGADEAIAWVTGVGDGLPRPGTSVMLYDREGKERARGLTDSLGIVRFTGLESEGERGGYSGREGYLAAQLESDRAVVSVGGYDRQLSPWQFNVRPAWGNERRPMVGAVFTERGIYRPGERVYVKAIVRRGLLGELTAASGDSLRWRFTDRERKTIRDTVVVLNEFGTSAESFQVSSDAGLGRYQVSIDLRESGDWVTVDNTGFRVAEYRPPEFLVDASAAKGERLAGDTLTVHVEARYLFGAPMSRARVSWVARERPTSAGAIGIPGTSGYYLGESGRWWEGEEVDRSQRTLTSGEDTLDAEGHLSLELALPPPRSGRPARTIVDATVTDINRQSVSASASVITHPAEFYIGARPEGERYFWRTGEEQAIGLIAVRPDGERVPDVSVQGVAVRREWHRVRRERAGRSELVGEWVSDTVASCEVTTQSEPVPCRFTPEAPGSYVLTFRATDAAGRKATSGFYRWVVGEDWVPWYDESQLKMDVIADADRYEVGDTATVLFASPFTDAEAWVTVEREGLIESRRLRLTSGSTALRFPITEAYAPNVYVSMLVVKGRTAPPSMPDDPGRPTIRVGYAELRVTPEVKRLAVDVEPLSREYRPGDTARVALQVRDRDGRGRRAEVTLWAVDEGVLALTGYQTPDPIDLIYRARGLGMALGSNMAAVAEQVAVELEEAIAKGAPGGGGGMDASGILRSQFRSTAFFLGSVVTDADGRAVAAAKLPDNLTTFRVMAVAVTEGDRYGSGASSLLVTRPLLARPALPRFLRPGDEFDAGVVVNHRLGGTPRVEVETEVENVQLLEDGEQSVSLERGRGVEARFRFRGIPSDSATFRFKVSGAGEADAVQKRLAVRPDHHPRAHTVSGVVWDSATALFELPGDIDPARSRLEINLGGSSLAFIQGARRQMRVYPYYCSEQVASAALPLIALYRAGRAIGRPVVEDDAEAEIRDAVQILSRRQRADGGIGFWHAGGWTNAWVSAHAGQVLLEARAAGFAVEDTVLSRLGDYLAGQLRKDRRVRNPLISWYDRAPRVFVSDMVAAVDYLSRIGRANVAAENSLMQRLGQMAWEDRLRMAEVMARRDPAAARLILEAAWEDVDVESRRAILPDSVIFRDFYFRSPVRPYARLLTATLAVQSDHRLVGPLVAALASRGRIGESRPWTTQDYGSAVLALLRYEELRTDRPDGQVRLSGPGGHPLAVTGTASPQPLDTTLSLQGMLEETAAGTSRLRTSIAVSDVDGPVFYYLAVREVPREPPVRPADAGIQVSRWYERYDRPGESIVQATEGELVRVKLRIHVPNERHFFVLDDALPAGLEAVDVSLRTEAKLDGADVSVRERETEPVDDWWYGSWYYGYWSPFEHRELRDDRVVYYATVLWPGTYETSYVARATTPGEFVRPPAHAEEMYNPGVNGRSDGGSFTVRSGED